ncbi:WD and tetratricopeptide repeats protein 1 isoform X1 [Petromyzon marinus]|uniref:WD and tetratricopeptide repeats protein 1 isoform X1 n=1 Tax=Petromyzon marinus TaxID=7757 RepID=A0AAJ7XC60_PETMA|nr:WD and tetratricopeptide repeats protein 1 isoform X1 [Petromyzon marinus]
MDPYNVTMDIINRQIRERGVLSFQRRQHVTDAMVRRLGLEAELQGHTGCVNCLEWNEKGEMLASGSDDQHIILWDPLRHRKLLQMHTGHTANIFSVKFLPHSGDRLVVTGAADFKVHVHDVVSKETLHIFDKHTNRVKRIATAASTPHMFWSAGEDGTIRQFDLRESSNRSQVLVDLTWYCSSQVEAKCLAINPSDNTSLAVGANDPYVRLYDMRMITQHRKSCRLNAPSGTGVELDSQYSKLPDGAVQYYVAGHLPSKQTDYQRRFRTLAVTYLTFSPDGNELLVNMGGEQVYMFDLHSRQRPYCFSAASRRRATPGADVQNGKQANGVSNGLHLHSNGLRLSDEPQQPPPSPELPPAVEKLKQLANAAFGRQQWPVAVSLYNRAVALCPTNSVLYGNRAAAYMKRKWDGDQYAALRDCRAAVALNPWHLKAHFRLARCLYELRHVGEALACLDDFRGRFPEQARSSACDALDRDIKAALFSRTDSDDERKATDPTGGGGGGGGSGGAGSGGGRVRGFSEEELRLREHSYDYKLRYCGHCNTTTDIKEANYFGSAGQYVVAGSDDGSFFLWDKATCNLLRVLRGDESIVNCLQPHPSACLLASSGIDPVVRLWAPRPQNGFENERVVDDTDAVCLANQRRMNADPLEVMLLNMGYRITGLTGSELGSDDDSGSESQVQCRTT